MAANGGWQNADDEKRNVKCGSQNADHKMRPRQNADVKMRIENADGKM